MKRLARELSTQGKPREALPSGRVSERAGRFMRDRRHHADFGVYWKTFAFFSIFEVRSISAM